MNTFNLGDITLLVPLILILYISQTGFADIDCYWCKSSINASCGNDFEHFKYNMDICSGSLGVGCTILVYEEDEDKTIKRGCELDNYCKKYKQPYNICSVCYSSMCNTSANFIQSYIAIILGVGVVFNNLLSFLCKK